MMMMMMILILILLLILILRDQNRILNLRNTKCNKDIINLSVIIQFHFHLNRS